MSEPASLEPTLSVPERRARLDAFREFIVALQRAGEAARTYSPGHPSVQQAVDKLQERLTAVLTKFGEIEFEVTGAGIVFDGQPMTARGGGRDFLARSLFAEGVRRVSILQGAPVDEVRTLVNAWTRHRDEGQGGGESLASRFWEADFKSIRLVILDTLDLSGQEGDGGEKIGADAGWRSTFQSEVESLMSLMQHQPPPSGAMEAGAVVVSAESLALLDSEGIRDITADDLARHDVTLQRAEDASASARAALAKAATEELQQSLPRFWMALLNAAVMVPGSRDACAAACAHVSDVLAAEGHFEQAIDAFQRLLEATRADQRHGTERVAALTEFRKALTTDKVLEKLVLALDDDATAAAADASLRKLGRAFGPKMLELGQKLKTDAGRTRVEAIAGVTPAPGVMMAPVKQLDEKGLLAALENVARLPPNDAAELIGRALAQADVRVRRAAAQKLDESNALLVPKARLHNRLGDTDATVRRLVIRALGLIEDASAAPLLKVLLQKELPDEERVVIYTALGGMHSAQAQELLVEGALNQKDVAVRVACIEALVNFPTPHVTKTLEGLAGKLLVNPKVRRAASDVLAKMEKGGKA
ncbi:MAG: hypothetical protein JNJ54_28020 [Myxococcaceae bacterium]|nr:hypothetical protein [Myxococcaceae bacterium]